MINTMSMWALLVCRLSLPMHVYGGKIGGGMEEEVQGDEKTEESAG